MMQNKPGVLGIAQGADAEDALFTDLSSVAAPSRKEADLYETLAEGLPEYTGEETEVPSDGNVSTTSVGAAFSTVADISVAQ